MMVHFSRLFLLYLLNITMVILSMQTIDFVAVENVHTIFFLAAVFYWTVHLPMAMPLWFVFLGGVAIDFAVDAPLGLHSFGLVLFAVILNRFRLIIMSQPFLYHLILFLMVAALFEVVRWIALCLLSMSLVPVYPALLSVVVNIVAFVPLTLVFGAVHRVISSHGRTSL